jgi:SAM-dependent methyltransferase
MMGATDEQIIHSWEERARVYQQFTEQWSLFPQLANRLVDLIPAPFSGTAIDLAAGAGLVSGCFLQRHPDARVYLVEPAEAMLALALPQLEDRVIGHAQLRAEEIGTLSIQADVILCSVAMHLIDEVQVFPGIVQCLKPDGLFIFNLWWHSWEPTAYINPGPQWRAVLEQSLAELVEPNELPVPLPAPSQPRLRTLSGLTQAAQQAGLTIIQTTTDTDQVPLRFFIEFSAMSAGFLGQLSPARRAAVLQHACARASQTVEIKTTRFVLQRSAS